MSSASLPLAYGFQSTTLFLPDTEQTWANHGKKGVEEYRVFPGTGLPAPMGQVFVKRLRRRRASGHDLLLSCLGAPLKYTPPFLGYAEEGGWHYYAYSFVDRARELSDIFENTLIRQSGVISRELVAAILNAVIGALEGINARDFYYPDLCYRNLLFSARHRGVLVIDVDSCMALDGAHLAPGTRVSQTWWALFAWKKLHSGAYLNATMAASLALALCRALAVLGSGAPNVSDTVLRGRPSEQEKVFAVLDKGDEATLQSLFRCPPEYREHIPFVLATWNGLNEAMRAGDAAPWPLVRQFALRLLAITGPEMWAASLRNGVLHVRRELSGSG